VDDHNHLDKKKKGETDHFSNPAPDNEEGWSVPAILPNQAGKKKRGEEKNSLAAL